MHYIFYRLVRDIKHKYKELLNTEVNYIESLSVGIPKPIELRQQFIYVQKFMKMLPLHQPMKVACERQYMQYLNFLVSSPQNKSLQKLLTAKRI